MRKGVNIKGGWQCCRVVTLLVCALVLGACTQSVDDASGFFDSNPVDLLPASTRGVLQLRNSDAIAGLLREESPAPWRQSPADITRYYLGQSSLVAGSPAELEQLILGQTLASEHGLNYT